MDLPKLINDLSELLKDSVGLVSDFNDGDNIVDLAPVADDLTDILRNELKLPIPEGFVIESIKFKLK